MMIDFVNLLDTIETIHSFGPTTLRLFERQLNADEFMQSFNEYCKDSNKRMYRYDEETYITIDTSRADKDDAAQIVSACTQRGPHNVLL